MATHSGLLMTMTTYLSPSEQGGPRNTKCSKSCSALSPRVRPTGHPSSMQRMPLRETYPSVFSNPSGSTVTGRHHHVGPEPPHKDRYRNPLSLCARISKISRLCFSTPANYRNALWTALFWLVWQDGSGDAWDLHLKSDAGAQSVCHKEHLLTTEFCLLSDELPC